MGQKVNPHGLRVGVIKDWDSRWYAREDKVGDLLVEDYNIRKYLKTSLYSAGIAKIEIERDNTKVKIVCDLIRGQDVNTARAYRSTPPRPPLRPCSRSSTALWPTPRPTTVWTVRSSTFPPPLPIPAPR